MADIDHIRHTLSHLLATAVLDRFPKAKLAIGPTIENGFYYDFEVERPFIPQDLPKLEKRMRELIRQKISMTEVSAASLEEAGAHLADSPYKQELFRDLKTQAQRATFFKLGTFVDLCRGGHIHNTSEIDADAFKLTKIAGAYWRGDSSQPMLQRIYGVAFSSKAELEEYLTLQAEAEKRDHRKLGKELGIFSMHGVAPGSVFWLPNGMTIVRSLEDMLRSEYAQRGYQEISTPQLVKKELWEQSGHWQNYRENMFTLNIDEDEYGFKAMNCPESTLVYRETTRSYRDLPLRFAEFGRLHRNEVAGALGGLFRVRSFTQDDAHFFCRPDQIMEEISQQLKFTVKVHKLFGYTPTFNLATRPDKAMGDPSLWKQAEDALATALKKNKIDYAVREKDGAFYGPKIDIDVKDSLGRTWTIATIQLDFQLPERFQLEYTDDAGTPQRPVMIHRAILGSFERFIGLLIEHTAGRLPTWLAPTQVNLIAVGKTHVKACQVLAKEFATAGIRVSVQDENESVGYKIRAAEKMKVPYMLVIGDKEAKSSKLHVRIRGKKDVSVMTKKAFIERLSDEITKRKFSPRT